MRIAEENDKIIAQERYEDTRSKYLAADTLTNLNTAMQEKDEARKGFIVALRDFWIAYTSYEN